MIVTSCAHIKIVKFQGKVKYLNSVNTYTANY